MAAKSTRPRPVSEEQLVRAARTAAGAAYAPYSNFRVGAAVLTGSGQVFTGCNVENASYGLCNCAERTAIFSAVAAGERSLTCVVVYTPTAAVTAPCGACRQVINEFGPQARVICVADTDARLETTAAELLPASFGPAHLAAAKASPPPRVGPRRRR